MKIDPKMIKFRVHEWLWALTHGHKHQAPYQGLTPRKALILMRRRGETPVDPMDVYRELYGEPKADEYVPYMAFTKEGLQTFEQGDHAPYLSETCWPVDGGANSV